MIAFDLKSALAGCPVVTRRGMPVKILGWLPELSEPDKLAGIYDGELATWGANGAFDPAQEGCSLDLFLASKVPSEDTPKWAEGGAR